jgi:uncharacterized DUF497 family protein
MYISDIYVTDNEIYFERDKYNIEHVKRHQIDLFEIEVAFLTDKNKKVFLDKAHSSEEEQRYIVLAYSENMHSLLKIVFCIRKSMLRVITAHKASNDNNLLALYQTN